MKNRSLEHTIRDVHELYGSGTAKMNQTNRHTGPRINPEYSSTKTRGHGAASDTSRAKMSQSETATKNLKAEETVSEAKKKEYEGGPEKKDSTPEERARAVLHGAAGGATVAPEDIADRQKAAVESARRRFRGRPEVQQALDKAAEARAPSAEQEKTEIEKQAAAAQENPGYAAAGSVAALAAGGASLLRRSTPPAPRPAATPTTAAKPKTPPSGRTQRRVAGAAELAAAAAGAAGGSGGSNQGTVPTPPAPAQHRTSIQTRTHDISARPAKQLRKIINK